MTNESKYTRKNLKRTKPNITSSIRFSKHKTYDFVVLGGGIGGMNVAYQILKRFPNSTLAILEKGKRLGGRVFTYNDKSINVEAGAGRFNAVHFHLIKLIKELGLYSRVFKINSSAVYAKNGRFYNSVLDSDSLLQGYAKNRLFDVTNFNMYEPFFGVSESIKSISDIGLDIMMGSDVLPTVGILSKIIFSGMLERKERLINMTLLEYASAILTKEEILFLKDSFGYYSEIVVMNAYDSIRLMRGLDPKNPFYGLSGGLSLIIDALEKRILEFSGARIFRGKSVLNLQFVEKTNQFIVVCNGGSRIYCNKCICALPKQAIERWTIFKPIRPLLKKIHCSPLCRIYSRFDVSEKGEVWFKGLPKFTTNNNLRMVIPISEKTGVIMISYTDNIFATFWKKRYDKNGLKSVEDELIRLMKESTGIDIPRPNQTEIFYWDCGAGYWGVGADSSAISDSIIHPFSNGLFICGEHYSATYQQWMEGALETGDRIVQQLI
jgi:hypothetical protein